MTAFEAYELLNDVRADYTAIVRELNALKRRIRPVDPWKLPLVERMDKAIYDLGMASGAIKGRDKWGAPIMDSPEADRSDSP